MDNQKSDVIDNFQIKTKLRLHTDTEIMKQNTYYRRLIFKSTHYILVKFMQQCFCKIISITIFLLTYEVNLLYIKI